jgi:hypothetical protein
MSQYILLIIYKEPVGCRRVTIDRVPLDSNGSGSRLQAAHFISAKLRNVCYTLHELYVTSVYLNLFGWRGD